MSARLSGSDEAQQFTQLLLLYEYGAIEDPAVAESIVDVVAKVDRTPAETRLFERLQRPASASFLIPTRHPANLRERLGADSPAEFLQRYVVLEFGRAEAARLALVALKLDRNVKSVSPNGAGEFSVSPSDPLFVTASSPMNYQWGLHALGMPYAWDLARGHAYIGHVDSGVQLDHPDLNYRPQFSYSFDGGSPGEITIPATFPRGHGTHTAGIIAASTSNPTAQNGYPNPPTPIGVAGTCWHCTLLVARVVVTGIPALPVAAVVAGMSWAVDSGAQVINVSLGFPPSGGFQPPNCASDPYDAFCLVLSFASSRQVVISAAAGNGMNPEVQFPASDSRTIAVGAVQSYAGDRGYLWTEENPIGDFRGSNWGSPMQYWGVVAPGRDVLSTAFTNDDWFPQARCGDNGFGSNAGIGYGICTGTSMAAPFVSGLAGIMRSANPLLSADYIRALILLTSSEASAPNQWVGYGMPNGYIAVWVALNSANRLTPLFALYGPYTRNYFYTTAPQMGSAAVIGTMPPYVSTAFNWYSALGTSVPEISVFPRTAAGARRVMGFHHPHEPGQPNVELRPLLRLSFKCGDPLPPGATSVCASYPYHVDHFYSTDYNEAQIYVSAAGYKIDGIEGYVYPYGYAQPANTEALIRAYNPAVDDHAIFPQSLQASMASQGYTVNVTTLGYVYRNNGIRPSY
ncbi:MAG: S8 family serine peptidase [Betaproteobacteria bacterium]|nr:S8 family serine peptidase [Betaproteobacteria bacterium]